MRGRVWSEVAVAAVLVASCGVPTEGTPRRIAERRLPESLRPESVADSTPGPAREAVTVWLVRDGHLVAVTHEVEAPATAATTVADLAAAPTLAEQRQSLRSAIPDGQVIVSVAVSGGTATIALADSFDQILTTDQVLAIGQLVLTLTDLRGIGQVRFELDTTEIAVPLPDGRSTDGAVSADDYRSLIGP
ncbi:MAG: GerMN domain-containing protein [Ilumatobacteraceae bacterium]